MKHAADRLAHRRLTKTPSIITANERRQTWVEQRMPGDLRLVQRPAQHRNCANSHTQQTEAKTTVRQSPCWRAGWHATTDQFPRPPGTSARRCRASPGNSSSRSSAGYAGRRRVKGCPRKDAGRISMERHGMPTRIGNQAGREASPIQMGRHKPNVLVHKPTPPIRFGRSHPALEHQGSSPFRVLGQLHCREIL